jgi:RsiW-degrading membrane proteinase PrsW (M82 family)
MATSQNWTPRKILFFGGLALWLLSTLVQTRMGTLVSLWTALLFAALLLLATLPTRTLTLAELIQPFCLGGAMIGVAVLIGWGMDAVWGTGATAARALGMPLVEETLKIAPALWVLYRLKERRWTLGVTDVLLLAAAGGLGFYWVEESFVIRNEGSWSFIGSFPTTDITGGGHSFIAGHAIWASLSGLGIGLALLLRGSKLQMLLVGVSGFLWSVLDHGANNYIVTVGGLFGRVLQFISAEGYLSLYIFLIGICGAVALDLYFAYIAVPKLAEVRLPSWPSSWDEARRSWWYLRQRRQFAYAVARYQRESGLVRARLAVISASVDAALHNWHLLGERANRTPA